MIWLHDKVHALWKFGVLAFLWVIWEERNSCFFVEEKEEYPGGLRTGFVYY